MLTGYFLNIRTYIYMIDFFLLHLDSLLWKFFFSVIFCNCLVLRISSERGRHFTDPGGTMSECHKFFIRSAYCLCMRSPLLCNVYYFRLKNAFILDSDLISSSSSILCNCSFCIYLPYLSSFACV